MGCQRLLGSQLRSRERDPENLVFRAFFANGHASRYSIFTVPGHHTSVPSTDTRRKRWLWESIAVVNIGGFRISGSHTLSASFLCYEEERHE